VNDFDETLPGPWEWDIKRLAASLAVASRSREFTDKERRRVVTASAETYRQAMRGFAEMRNVDVWYARMDVDRAIVDLASQLSPVSLQRTKAGLAKARTHDSLQALSKLTRVVDGQRRIISNPPLIVPIEEVLPEVEVDQARSGDRIAITSYLGNGRVFDEAIAAFSERYADQNQRDYEALQRAAANGTITAEVGL
jgi:hypothetical protein